MHIPFYYNSKLCLCNLLKAKQLCDGKGIIIDACKKYAWWFGLCNLFNIKKYYKKPLNENEKIDNQPEFKNLVI